MANFGLVEIKFIDDTPRDLTLNPILISGSMSSGYPCQKFLTLSEESTVTKLYEIKYEVHFSPFEEALVIDNLLAVGHEEHFYLFNFITNESILRLEMNGYFGHLYYDNGAFYIADAIGLHCIDKNGQILWHNAELGIDGVIVNEFTDSMIFGSGEFDPPGGWIDFSIDKLTGTKVT